jgi:hypothetical protein
MALTQILRAAFVAGHDMTPRLSRGMASVSGQFGPPVQGRVEKLDPSIIEHYTRTGRISLLPCDWSARTVAASEQEPTLRDLVEKLVEVNEQLVKRVSGLERKVEQLDSISVRRRNDGN